MIPKKPAPDLIISAFTRVHSPSQTGVNALMDTLWVDIGFRKDHAPANKFHTGSIAPLTAELLQRERYMSPLIVVAGR